MHALDDLAFLTRNDPTDMAGLTRGFADQCRIAWDIAESVDYSPIDGEYSHILVTGLGGSAAGGDLLSALLSEIGAVPGSVNRDYGVPSFVGCRSLVFATSYSGNTEETLAAAEDARLKGATIIAVTSGGKLAEWAGRHGIATVRVPGGQPPRTALGFMFLPLVVACVRLGLLPDQNFEHVIAQIRRAATIAGFDSPFIQNPAKQMAEFLHGSVPILYGASPWLMSIAQRWRGQLNENAKVITSTHVFPELCHNEILGWEGAATQSVDEWRGILLCGGTESARMQTRIQITLDLIGEILPLQTVSAEGELLLARMLYLAHFGDWLSLYMAALAGRDPGQMKAIDDLKSALAKID
jgi:glucose/mannose-6-phosphate isomerase